MNIIQVQYVLTVAEQGSMSKAAESLFVSQPALSLQIKKLENELGFALFYRTAQGVSLTPEGQEFCESAGQVRRAWEELEKTGARLGQKNRDRVCIRLGPRVFSNELFPRIVTFFDSHPEIEPTFMAADDGNFLQDLRDGSIDLALSYLPPEEQVEDIRRFFHCELIREQQCVLCGHDHPLAGRERMAFRELQDHTIITAPEHSMEARMLHRSFQEHGIQPRRVYRVDNVDTTLELVRAGKGVIVGPRSFAVYHGVCAVPLTPAAEESLSFICLRENRTRPEIKAFCRYLQEICREKEH